MSYKKVTKSASYSRSKVLVIVKSDQTLGGGRVLYVAAAGQVWLKRSEGNAKAG
jgi:hypothetical protein